MKIRGALTLSTLATTAGLLVLAVTIIWSLVVGAQHVPDGVRLNMTVRKIVIMRALMLEFQYTGSPRSAQQTRIAYDELGQVLHAIAVKGTASRDMMQRTIREYDAVGVLFARLADFPFRPEEATNKNSVIDALDIRSAAMVADMLEIDNLLTAQMLKERQVTLLVVAGSVSILAGIILMLMRVLKQRVVIPIGKLEAVASKIIAGDLDTVIATGGNDEIARLATSLETMRVSLLGRIAQIKATSVALSASEQRYRILFNSMVDSFALYEIISDDAGRALDARFVAVNPAFERHTGLHAADILGGTLLEFFPKMKLLWIERLGIVASTGDPFHTEEVVDSLGRQYAVSTYPGTPGQVAVVFVDITERKRVAAELLQHRDALEVLVAKRTTELSELYNNAPCGYHSINAKGIFSNINDTELGWLGYTREELVGRVRAVDLLSPETRHIFYEVFPVLLAGGALRGIEVEAVRKDGSILPLLIHSRAVFDADGKFLHTLSTAVDNTERLIANQTLILARELAEQADREKSNFVANMSHEIRTPMHAMLGYVYLLDKMGLPDEEHALVVKIEKAGRLLLTLLNEILDFSKIGADKLQIEGLPFHLGDVLNNIAGVMSVCTGDKNLELTITPPPAEVDYLCGDAMRLEQVMNNLVSNAVKFTQAGSVDVRVSVVDLSPQRVTLRFAVSDTGIGVHEEVQKELFKPFTQANASTTRLFGGSGLGLAISRELVVLMGGEMGLISRPGSGSEFWFTLTFGREKAVSTVLPELVDIAVLIADSREVAREALGMAAANLGWTVDLVDDGRQAAERVLARHARGERHDVIILDWETPGTNALETARTIRELLLDDHQPVLLVVTGQARKKALLSIEGTHVDGVLSTPVTASSLRAEVVTALRKRRGEPSRSRLLPIQRLKAIRMLVVDDNEINRDVAVRIFSGEGALVAVASDGRQALDWLGAHSDEIDIVLMDIQMPVMDGYEAVHRIRQIAAFAHLPVVAMTARVLPSERAQALAAGMTDCLGKPFDIDCAIPLIQGLVAAPVAAPAAAPVPADGISGLALGLDRWGDATVYRQYLQKFACDYQDCMPIMRQADCAQAMRLAHEMAGVAGNLGLMAVADAAAHLDHALESGASAAAAFELLQHALDAAMQLIEWYVHAAPDSLLESRLHPAPLLEVSREILMTVSQLLLGIDEALAELDTHLPPEPRRALRGAIDNFNFRRTSVAVQAIAETGGSS